MASENQRQLLPPGAPSWVTEELIVNTLRVWGPKYEEKGVTLTPKDALEIILKVARLADTLDLTGR